MRNFQSLYQGDGYPYFQKRTDFVALFIGGMLFLVFMLVPLSMVGQGIPDSYGNNPALVKWRYLQTPHFKIVFRADQKMAAADIARQAEPIYQEYKQRLGTVPSEKISLYVNDNDEIVSGLRAQDTDEAYSIWKGDPFLPRLLPGDVTFNQRLRAEIAFAFQENITAFPVDYYDYLFSNSSQSPWSDGFVSYLAIPRQTPHDVSTMRNYRHNENSDAALKSLLADHLEIMLGRSQINYYFNQFKGDSLRGIYVHRQSLVGLVPYFDFNPAFKKGTGISYDEFDQRWENDNRKWFNKTKTAFAKREEKNLKTFPVFKDVFQFKGAAINQAGTLIAALVMNQSGSFTEELQINPLENLNGKIRTIDEGFFHPAMDWNPAKNQLIYSKRIYNNEKGNYFYQPYIWNAGDKKSQKISSVSNGHMPIFLSDRDSLAYVEKRLGGHIIWVINTETGQKKRAYSFDKTVEVSHLSNHPTQSKMLVSYRAKDNIHRAGILDMESKSFNPLPLQSELAMNAEWSPDGAFIYFNRKLYSVRNIFRVRLSGDNLSRMEPVTAQFYGTELWDVARDSTGVIYALGPRKQADWSTTIAGYPGGRKADASASKNYSSGSQVSLSSAMPPATNNASVRFSDDDVNSYRPFLNTRWEPPFAVPYYLNAGDFGLAGYAGLLEPLRRHAFNFYGIISIADPVNKSFFYSEYVNNVLRPRIELNYNYFPAASDWFGTSREVQKTNVVALTSLWRLTGLSNDFNDWYAGLTFRHLSIDYFSTPTLREHHPDIFFANQATNQTDIRATLAWRRLNPSRHTLIHPLDGNGLRFSVTAADDILGSDVQYTRLSLDGYAVLPAFGSHRIYVYANGVMDIGQPVGKDYLGFSDGGDYQLPGPSFTPSINPGVERFVRGYSSSLLGNRFLFGSAEYRIPFQFDTKKKLLGFIPPARTSFTFFTDAGVMGDARVSPTEETSTFRYSVGAEMKRVFSIGGSFKLTYELGIAQPLDQSLSPQPYFNVKTAVPF